MATVFSYEFSPNAISVLPTVTLKDGAEVADYVVQIRADMSARDEESGAIATHPINAELTSHSDRSSEGYVDISQAAEMPQFCVDAIEVAFNDEGNRSVLEMQLQSIINQPVVFNAPWDAATPAPPVEEETPEPPSEEGD